MRGKSRGDRQQHGRSRHLCHADAGARRDDRGAALRDRTAAARAPTRRCAARLGSEVAMVARVGDDLFGRGTVENFGARHRRKHVRAGVSSGVAPIFVDPSGQNRIIVVKGANDRLMPADVDGRPPTARERGLPRAAASRCRSRRWVCRTLRARRAASARLLNPAPALPIDLDVLTRRRLLHPERDGSRSAHRPAVRTARQAEQCAAALVERGFARVILTLGDRGALLAGEGRRRAGAGLRGGDDGHHRRRRRVHRQLR